MGYKVIYGESRVDRQVRSGSPICFVGAAAILVAILAASFIWPEWFDSFRKELFPLFYGSGWEAVKTFSNQLEEGTGIGDAVFAFCREIVTVAVP